MIVIHLKASMLAIIGLFLSLFGFGLAVGAGLEMFSPTVLVWSSLFVSGVYYWTGLQMFKK